MKLSRSISSATMGMVGLAVGCLFAGLGLLPGVAGAAFPGENGKIAYVTWSGVTGLETTSIHTVNPNGTGDRRLTVDDRLNLAPAFSPNGKRIAYVSGRSDHNSAEIRLMNADGTDQHRLTTTPLPLEFSPAFSFDGKRIYFTRTTSPPGYPTLVSTRLDGSDERAHLPKFTVSRVVSLPGGRLAWIGADTSWCKPGSDCVNQVWVGRPDGSDARQLTNVDSSRRLTELDSTPNGRHLILSMQSGRFPDGSPDWGGIATLEPDGPQRTWSDLLGRRLVTEEWATFAAVAPDAKRLTFLDEYIGDFKPTSLETVAIAGGPRPAWNRVLADPFLFTGQQGGSPMAWIDWGPKPGTNPGPDTPGPDRPTDPRDPDRCRISHVRSRFFVFRKKPVIRLVARYKAKHSGQVRIVFYARKKGNRLGRKLGRMNARFTKTTKKRRKFGFIRVRRKRSPALMKRLRTSKRGFIARLRVKNAPGYCRKLFNLDLRLSQLRFVDNQFVWFQKGTFKRGQKPPRFR